MAPKQSKIKVQLPDSKGQLQSAGEQIQQLEAHYRKLYAADADPKVAGETRAPVTLHIEPADMTRALAQLSHTRRPRQDRRQTPSGELLQILFPQSSVSLPLGGNESQTSGVMHGWSWYRRCQDRFRHATCVLLDSLSRAGVHTRGSFSKNFGITPANISRTLPSLRICRVVKQPLPSIGYRNTARLCR